MCNQWPGLPEDDYQSGVTASRDKELLEVPLVVAVDPLTIDNTGQTLIERMSTCAVNLDLLEHREVNAIVGRAEGRDLLRRPRLLFTKLVARETQNAEPLTLILVMQRHQPVILRREPTLLGYVDDQQDITSISTQRLRGAIETTNNKLIGKHEYLHALLRQTTVRGPVIVPRLL